MTETSLLRLLSAGSSRRFAEPGVKPNYASSRTVRISHIDLSLVIEPVAHTFTGQATLHVEPLLLHRGTATFDLDEVVVDSVVNGAGEAMDFHHANGVLEVDRVEGPTKITVAWHGENPTRGLYFTGPKASAPDRQHMAWTQCQDEDAHYIFPCFDAPGVKCSYSIRLEAPAGYTLLSNGQSVASKEEQGRAVAFFEQREPMPAYLFTAVVAKLTTFEAENSALSIRYLVPEGEEVNAMRSFGKTPQMIAAFSEKTGIDYPWPRYDQVVVHDFIFGGMENTACTSMTDVLLVDEKAALEYDPDGLVSHELAHQWFGDYVTCADWSQAWLNEAWATFMETVWWQHDRGQTEAVWYHYLQAKSYLEEDGGRYRRPMVSYMFREPLDVFDRHLYEKGSCIMSTLRHELGEEAFWAATKHYLQQNAYGSVYTRDFQRAFEESTGRNLGRFFEQWIYGAGHPELAVTLSESDGMLTIKVAQKQKGDQTAKAFAFNFNISIINKDKTEVCHILKVTDRNHTFAVPAGEAVSHVRVDPFFKFLSTMAISAPREWLLQTLHDPCPVLSVRSARALIKTGAQSAIDAVVEALQSHDFHAVRGEIAGMLAKRGGAAELKALIAALNTEKDPRIARTIVTALGKFRETAAADALIAKLEAGNLPTPHLHSALLAAIGATRDARAVDVITPHLSVDSWADIVRKGALSGLAATRDPVVLDKIIEYSGLAQSERTRASAAAALGALGDKVPETRTTAAERLMQMVKEPGFREQLFAIRAMGQLKSPITLTTLRDLHAGSGDGRVRRVAYEAAKAVQKGREGTEETSKLRDEVDELRAALQAIRDEMQAK